ncbi:MAG: hypothetical protein EOO61_11970 [Hymenobacter sp.]|nr:MAG: hypothetical protein EOO61_11970 [Hymenobacter sp.]
MSLSKLWQQLFISNDEETGIELHIAGATSRHRNPFQSLSAYRNQEEEPSEEFIDKWVMEFYMVSIANLDDKTFTAFVQASKEITLDVVREFLGDFNWRLRIVGTYFAAIKGYDELTDIIGVHLLQSEVCYAGAGYALAFAMFQSERAKDYLKAYLEYYLKQPDLWYDQADVLAALHITNPAEAATYAASWQLYVVDKPNHRLEDTINWLSKGMETVEKIRAASLS